MTRAFVETDLDRCFCCGHDRQDHERGGDELALSCDAELFSVGEEVLTDCPCGDFIYWSPGAVRVGMESTG